MRKGPYLLAAALAAAAATPRNVNAEEEIALTPDNPPDAFVELHGARSPDAPRCVSGVVDKTRRNIRVRACPNAPVFLDGACPPPSSYPGWKLDTSKKPRTGGDSAEVDDTAVERTGEDGTFTVRTTAPARAGQRLDTTFRCFRDTNGNKNPDDGEDQEDLHATIEAVNGAPGGEFLASGDERAAIEYKPNDRRFEFTVGAGLITSPDYKPPLEEEWRAQARLYAALHIVKLSKETQSALEAVLGYNYVLLPALMRAVDSTRFGDYTPLHEVTVGPQVRFPLLPAVDITATAFGGAQYQPSHATSAGGVLSEKWAPVGGVAAGFTAHLGKRVAVNVGYNGTGSRGGRNHHGAFAAAGFNF